MQKYSGKVRDVYDLSDGRLVIVTTDRISAFDSVLPKTVPGKGKILNAISLFWFDYTKDIIANHIISAGTCNMPEMFRTEEFEGRTVLVRKLDILPFECIVRGYMFGSIWDAYKRGEEFCGQKITGNFELAEKLEQPLFTPSTKAHSGHDEYISIEHMENAIGREMTGKLRDISLKLYNYCRGYAYEKGIILADTKFEFGIDEDNNLYLADEIFTPDSSRFWSLEDYRTGISPKSYDKQLIRDWLANNKVDGQMRFDDVPDDIIEKTAEIYEECHRRLTGQG